MYIGTTVDHENCIVLDSKLYIVINVDVSRHAYILASTLKAMYNSEIQHYTISTIHSGSNIHVSSICQINTHITSWVQFYL